MYQAVLARWKEKGELVHDGTGRRWIFIRSGSGLLHNEPGNGIYCVGGGVTVLGSLLIGNRRQDGVALRFFLEFFFSFLSLTLTTVQPVHHRHRPSILKPIS